MKVIPIAAGDALAGVVSIGDAVKNLLDDLKLGIGVPHDYARVKR